MLNPLTEVNIPAFAVDYHVNWKMSMSKNHEVEFIGLLQLLTILNQPFLVITKIFFIRIAGVNSAPFGEEIGDWNSDIGMQPSE